MKPDESQFVTLPQFHSQLGGLYLIVGFALFLIVTASSDSWGRYGVRVGLFLRYLHFGYRDLPYPSFRSKAESGFQMNRSSRPECDKMDPGPNPPIKRHRNPRVARLPSAYFPIVRLNLRSVLDVSQDYEIDLTEENWAGLEAQPGLGRLHHRLAACVSLASTFSGFCTTSTLQRRSHWRW